MSGNHWGRTKAVLVEHWFQSLVGEPFEVFEIALLDATGNRLGETVQRLGVGSVDRVAIYPRQVMRAAVRSDAAAVVLCHNHPSGNNEPTDRDIDATRMVYLAGVTLDVRLFDHVIVSRNGPFSFREQGLL